MGLWNGRFSATPDEALTNFSESISFDKRLYKHDIRGSKAHASMLSGIGVITQVEAASIHQGLDKIQNEIDSGEFVFDAKLEDIHMHVESALTLDIGDAGAKLHTGRSRNDQVATDIRLYLLDVSMEIIDGIRTLQKALLAQADSHSSIVMPGYTHLQRAQPVLYAHHLLAYVEMFDRDISRVQDCRHRMDVMPLGAGALAGSTLPLDREATRRHLGFRETSRNSMDSVADRDFACEFLSALAIFAVHLSRISEDIVLWCSAEFGFVELADAFCTGSSLMPQKKNPDVAELSRGKSARVIGNLMTLLTLMKGLPLTYNRDLQEDKEPVFDSVDTVKAVLSVFPQMIATMTPRAEAMAKAAADPALMATDLAERLVRLGLPFRSAHHRVGALVKWCKENNRKLDQLQFDEMRSVIPEADEKCLQLFSSEQSVQGRDIVGGTAPKQVISQIEFWNTRLHDV